MPLKPQQAPGKKGKTPPPAPKAPAKKDSHAVFLFTRDNYQIMLIGLAVLVLGFLLMVGGGSQDPNQFHPDKIYSWRRITLAPLVILVGFLIEIYAIMKKPKTN